MLMSRTTLAVASGLLLALAGMRRASSLRSEAARLCRWMELLEQLALILSERSASLPQALRIAADRTLLPDRLCHSVAAQMHLHPVEPLGDIFARLSTPCAEHDTLLRMFSRLGRGTLESRQQAIAQAGEELALLTEQAQQRAARDAKLWQTLGWVGGACLTLLLI